MSAVLGVDIGTQSLKVVIYDFEAGQTVAVASAALDIQQAGEGVAEQQAAWWIAALANALQQIPSQLRRRVRALGVSGQQHGFVPLDNKGQVLAPVKLWCDTSTAAHCASIMDALGGVEACIKVAGNPILPGYTASKVRWFREERPELYARLAHILLPHDYLNYYLTGEIAMEAGDASGTAFFDVRNRQWSSELLAAIDPHRDLRDCLPSVRTDNGAIGQLLPSVAESLGLPAGVPVAIGGGDNMMGAIGTANVSVGAVTVSLGTSGTVYAYSDTPVIDPRGEIAAFCSSSGGWLPLLCTMNCTVSTELMRKLVGAELDAFEAQIHAAPAGASGVLTLPFFTGERTPNLPQAKGVVLGLDRNNTQPANLLRSAAEGATFALRHGFDRMQNLGVTAQRIVLTGGGAKSRTWRQLVADVFNTPVAVLKNDEGAAFGAALQSLAVLQGGSADLAGLTAEHVQLDESAACYPDPLIVDTYAQVYRDYQDALAALTLFYGAKSSPQ